MYKHIASLTVSALTLGLASPLALADAHYDEDGAPRGPGIGIAAGGGVAGFVDDDSREFIDVGGLWEARLTVGTRLPIAGEIAYVGTAQNVDVPLLEDVSLIGQGVEGGVRLNVGSFAVQPYAHGGIGWMHYTVNNDGETSSIRPDDDILTLPAGAGVSFHAYGALVDLRGTYRFAADDEMIDEDIENLELSDKPDFDSWSATARVGFEF